MTFWVAGAVIGSAVIGSSAANKASNTQAAAATQSADVSKQISDQQIALQREQFAAQVGLQEPWRQAGINALNKMQGGAFAQPAAFKFGAGDYQADPGYAFRLAEGQKALDRQAAARGGLISGGALKAAQRYGQEMGSQEYQNAYNRALTGYNTDVARSDTGYNRLASLAGVGQTATDKVGAAGQSMVSGISGSLGAYGNAASDAYQGAANARASGYVGTANAINQGLGSYLNYTQSQNLLNRLSPQVPYNAYTTVPMQPGGGY
jgi:hypothetical protein